MSPEDNAWETGAGERGLRVWQVARDGFGRVRTRSQGKSGRRQERTCQKDDRDREDVVLPNVEVVCEEDNHGGQNGLVDAAED